jgi:hypothetical protein
MLEQEPGQRKEHKFPRNPASSVNTEARHLRQMTPLPTELLRLAPANLLQLEPKWVVPNNGQGADDPLLGVNGNQGAARAQAEPRLVNDAARPRPHVTLGQIAAIDKPIGGGQFRAASGNPNRKRTGSFPIGTAPSTITRGRVPAHRTISSHPCRLAQPSGIRSSQRVQTTIWPWSFSAASGGRHRAALAAIASDAENRPKEKDRFCSDGQATYSIIHLGKQDESGAPPRADRWRLKIEA